MVSDRLRNRHLYAPLGAAGRPRQHSQQLFCVARERIFARRAKTNLPMCLKPRERLSLGRFAERVSTCLDLSAAEVPCKTAPFASFSGRAEKEGPARPERVSISSSLVKANKKGRRNAEILRNGFCVFYETISLFRQAIMPDARHPAPISYNKHTAAFVKLFDFSRSCISCRASLRYILLFF